MRILVVDDEPDILLIVRVALEESGEHTVLQAETAEDALEIAQTGAIDGILMDVTMPFMDGHEALKRLKAMETTRAIPVVFLTAMTRERDIAAGLALGAAGYITKPFNPCLLADHIQDLLSGALAAPAGQHAASPGAGPARGYTARISP
jgi:two-component system, OmpR family, response regulator